MSKLIDTTFEGAIDVLRRNSVREGLRTSAAYYNQIWARDAFISFLGANPLRDRELLQLARKTIRTFSRTASPLGQIANFFDLRLHEPEYGYSGSTDSTAWYVIGLASLFSATEDGNLLREPLTTAVNAYRWLRYQDANNTWLIDSPPGADWMDAAVQRTGKTLYNNVLLLMSTLSLKSLLRAAGRSSEGQDLLEFDELEQRFSDVFLPGPGSVKRLACYWRRLSEAYQKGLPRGYDGGHYLHYISFSRIDTRFDTFSNLLCMLSGFSNERATEGILDLIHSRHLTEPYPIRVLDPPYANEGAGFDKGFNSSLPVQHSSLPYAYHNGAVWPFVGGVYVAALCKEGNAQAAAQLEALARANSRLRRGEKVGFNEWLHGKTGDPLGQYGQSWSAGWFVGAKLASEGVDAFSFLRD